MHRLKAALRDAARRGRIFRQCWHPYNFSRYHVENFETLNAILYEFSRLAEAEGMRSLAMRDIAQIAQAFLDLSGNCLKPNIRTARLLSENIYRWAGMV